MSFVIKGVTKGPERLLTIWNNLLSISSWTLIWIKLTQGLEKPLYIMPVITFLSWNYSILLICSLSWTHYEQCRGGDGMETSWRPIYILFQQCSPYNGTYVLLSSFEFWKHFSWERLCHAGEPGSWENHIIIRPTRFYHFVNCENTINEFL